jgi:hypothetical protein
MPTLRDHLIGEVIGPLLVKKCRTPISLLCCDQPESLRIETSCEFPIVIVVEATEEDEGPFTSDSLTGYTAVELAGSTLQVPIEQADLVRQIVSKLGDLPDAVEPFERIREAIKEAQSQIARAQTPIALPESRAA